MKDVLQNGLKKKKEKGIANHITRKDLLSGKYPYETFTTQL